MKVGICPSAQQCLWRGLKLLIQSFHWKKILVTFSNWVFSVEQTLMIFVGCRWKFRFSVKVNISVYSVGFKHWCIALLGLHKIDLKAAETTRKNHPHQMTQSLLTTLTHVWLKHKTECFGLQCSDVFLLSAASFFRGHHRYGNCVALFDATWAQPAASS